MKGIVDQELCVGCGMCAAAAPDAFRMTEGGASEGYQEIPAQSVDDARQAAEDCPVAAIRIE